ncbi:MAG: 3-dehydroquinate synthase [bacterium]
MKTREATRTHTFHQRLTVLFDFPVVFTRNCFAPSQPLLARMIDRLHEKRRHRVMVCLDASVAAVWPRYAAQIGRYFKAYSTTLELAGPIELVGGGEKAKDNLTGVTRMIRLMAKRNLDRQSVVMIIGGGSLLDMTGFAASLVHRGLRVVRLPTTVAGQNDVGVGVKTGIDWCGNKNFLGTFAPPFAVINDLDFLDLLPDRDWIAGIAEAFKVALIKDRRFFEFLCRHAARLRNRDRKAMEKVVRQCARLHLDHIREGGDPFETGSARPLDFGHWSAHHLEVLSHYRLRHGEAVSIGIALDSYYAMRTGLISGKVLCALLTGLQEAGLPVWHPVLNSRDTSGVLSILTGLTRFQEHLGGPLTITLPSTVGHRTEVHRIDPAIIEDGIRFLSTLRKTP